MKNNVFFLIFLFLLVNFLGINAYAGLDYSGISAGNADLSTYAKKSDIPSSAILPGTFTVATLPVASTVQAKYAFVTDLGGGSDMVLSDGTNWKHIRQGVVKDVAISSTIPVTPLISPPVMRITGSGFATASTINIKTDKLYPGYTLHIVVPTGVLGTLGTLGVSVDVGPSIPLIAGTWADMMWNGTDLVTTAKGTL